MANQIIVESGTSNITVTTSRSVIGTVANVASANTANTVTNNAQPNITSVGTLTSLAVSGNANANIVNATYLYGDGSNISNITVGAGTQIINGTTEVDIPSVNGNVNMTVAGTANVVQVTSSNVLVKANILPTSNITYDLGSNTQRFKDIWLANSTIYLGNQSISSDAGNVTITGNLIATIDANSVIGPVANANYALVSGTAYSVAGANVSGDVAGANYANFAGTAYSIAGANVTGTVANANYANVAGTAYSVAVGNVSGIGNIATVNLDGNVANVLKGDGTFGPEGTTGNANYANFAGTAYSVSGSNVSGAVANANYATDAGNANIANTAYSVAVGNVSGIGNIATVNLDGNSSNVLRGDGTFSAEAGNLNANFANFAGNVVNATQSNITSLGTLTGLDVSGTSNVTNVSVTGSITFNNPTASVDISPIADSNNSNTRSFTITAGNISNVLPTNTTAGTLSLLGGNATQNDAGNAWIARGGGLSAQAGSGTTANGNAFGGAFIFSSGSATTTNGSANAGAFQIAGAAATSTNGAATTANVNLLSGAATATSGNSRSGNIVIRTNAANSATSGTATVGNVIIDTGTPNGVTANVKGIVAIGNSGNANAVSIGHASTPANINGVLNVTGNTNANIVVANYYYGDGSNLSNINGANVSTVANANYAAYAGDVVNASQSNITSLGTLTSLTVSGNIVGQSNVYVNDTLVFANTVQVTSPGYYLPYGFTFTGGSPNTSVLYTVNVQGDVTNGSNVVSNVAIYDAFSGSPLNLSNYAPLLANLSLIPVFTQGVGYYNSALPDLGTISNVDAGNSTITYSNNFTDTKTVNILTGIIAYNTSNDTYFGMQRALFATALSTDSSNNQITLDTADPIDLGVGVGAEIKFVGTSFGNISANTSYYVDSVDLANVAITISETQGGPVHSLTTATGTMYIVNSNADGVTIRTDLDTFYAGPWDTVPTYANLSVTTNPNFATTPVINVGYSKPVNYNDNPPNQIPGGFVSQIQYNQLVGPTVVGTKGAPTLSGTLQDGFGLNGITAINDGTDANLTGLRTSFATISYTDGGSDNASITNPGNPTGFQMSSFTGNSQTAPEDQYLRSGRALGRIAFYASQRVNGSYYANPGTSPYAGIYAQALGDWSSDVNTSLPMVMAFQYTPLNAATGAGSDYQRINRTFLQAANNTTSIGGATNIEFKPLARSSNGTNNRSPSALGNVSINPQTFVDIRGYTAGNAVSNGAGAVLNVTTTASTWNGNVALRLSRTVGNTANMEFRLPTASANTMLLVDNASGNTIATFTDGYANVTGEINATGRINNYLRTYGSFSNSNDIAITANTVANLDLPTTSSANGISIASSNQITVARAGTYNIQFSLQLTNSDNAADHEFDVWFAKNGNDIADSATTYTVIKNNGKNVAALNFVDTCNANDYYQIRYAASSANISLESFSNISTPYTRPAIPSAIVTVVPVGA